MWNRQCKRTSPQLWGFAAGTLPEDELERVEQHLICCHKCREEAGQYKNAVRLLATFQKQPAPASRTTWDSLRASLETQATPVVITLRTPSRPARRPVFANLALGGATVAAMFAFALVLTRIFPDETLTNMGAVHSGSTNPNASRQASGSGVNRPAPESRAAEAERQGPKVASGSGHGLGSERKLNGTKPAPTHEIVTARTSGRDSEEPSIEPAVYRSNAKSHRPKVLQARERDYSPIMPDALLPHSKVQAPGSQLDVDGYHLVKYPERDDAPGASAPSSQGPARDYVMDTIPVSSPGLSAADIQQGAQEKKAW